MEAIRHQTKQNPSKIFQTNSFKPAWQMKTPYLFFLATDPVQVGTSTRPCYYNGKRRPVFKPFQTKIYFFAAGRVRRIKSGQHRPNSPFCCHISATLASFTLPHLELNLRKPSPTRKFPSRFQPIQQTSIHQTSKQREKIRSCPVFCGSHSTIFELL